MSRINDVTLHQVNDHDADETHQVALQHLADGQTIGYREDFSAAESGLVEALRATP